MKFRSQPFSFVLVLIIVMFPGACTPSFPAPRQDQTSLDNAFPPVILPSTEVRTLQSSHTGRDYDIYIRFPDDYVQSQRTYPVLYVLDGQWDFKLLDSIQGGLLYDGFTPDLLIVGITYSGEDADYDSLRAMDYTPVPVYSVSGSGDGPKFYDFLQQELIPFIETNYRADPSTRVLMGSSYGGLFTLYALFRDPKLFYGYVSGSPAVPYGNQFVFGQESEYAETHSDLPARLFLSVGGAEQLSYSVQQFMQILTEREYTGLALETRVIEDERHSGNKPEAYNRGLRFIFKNR